MSDTNVEPKKNKTSQQILAEMMAETDIGVQKEVRRSAKAWADDALKNVEPDIRALIVEKLSAKGDLDKDGKFIVPSKKSPNRSPMDYINSKYPSVFQKAETPNGNLEMETAIAACKSLHVQGQAVKVMGVQRLSELMSLVGGKVGTLSEPMAIKNDAPKAGRADTSPNNPFSTAGWNISKQGALVKSLGIEKAAAIARAVGVKLGDLRPNANFTK